MIKYEDGALLDLLPSYFKEKPEVRALSYALKCGVQEMLHFSRITGLYSNLSSMPEEILDYMATELNVSYYFTAKTVHKKREVIAEAIRIKMLSGTKYSVAKLCESIFGSSKVIEWFEMGGKTEPGVFDVELTTEEGFDEEFFKRFALLIEQVKNASSHIQDIRVRSPIHAARYTGVAAYSSPKDVIETLVAL